MRLLFLLSSFLSWVLLFVGLLSFINFRRATIQRRMERLFAKQKDSSEQEQSEQEQIENQSQKEDVKSFKDRVLVPLWGTIRGRLIKTLSPQTVKRLGTKLRDAGMPFQLTPLDFRALQIIIALGFFLLITGLFLPVAAEKIRILFLAATAGIFGFMYPELYIRSKKRQRFLKIQKSMPDFFDMVNVSIEAGMGLDAALSKVCKQLGGPLAQEFMQTLDEMRLGKSRREAFSNLRERISLDTFQSVMSALIQADQLGIGMAKVIRAQTRRIREHQRQQAKEQAMKAPIKMMFPLVLFIFPTLFIALLGPLIILLMKNLF